MREVFEVLELADRDGEPTGRYRYTRTRGHTEPIELCSCSETRLDDTGAVEILRGHATAAAAYTCPKVTRRPGVDEDVVTMPPDESEVVNAPAPGGPLHRYLVVARERSKTVNFNGADVVVLARGQFVELAPIQTDEDELVKFKWRIARTGVLG